MALIENKMPLRKVGKSVKEFSLQYHVKQANVIHSSDSVKSYIDHPC